jgi:hypothetical protein
VPRGRPELELCVAGRPELKQEIVAAIMEFDTGDRL